MRVEDRPQSIAGWRRLLGLNEAAALPAPATVARAYRRPLSISVGIAAALLLIGGGYLAFEPGRSGKSVSVDLVAEVQRAREALAAAEQRAKQRRRRKPSAERRPRTGSAPKKRPVAPRRPGPNTTVPRRRPRARKPNRKPSD